MAEGTRVICLKLCVALPLFFVVYYMVASLLSGAFKLSNFDGKIPFDFESCCSVEDDKQMVTLLSLLLTYIITTGIYVIFLKRQIWDYAITVGLFHLAMSCAVMQAFPTNWQWWIAFGNVGFYAWKVFASSSNLQMYLFHLSRRQNYQKQIPPLLQYLGEIGFFNVAALMIIILLHIGILCSVSSVVFMALFGELLNRSCFNRLQEVSISPQSNMIT